MFFQRKFRSKCVIKYQLNVPPRLKHGTTLLSRTLSYERPQMERDDEIRSAAASLISMAMIACEMVEPQQHI